MDSSLVEAGENDAKDKCFSRTTRSSEKEKSQHLSIAKNIPFLRRTLVPIRKSPLSEIVGDHTEDSMRETLLFTIIDVDLEGFPQCRVESRRDRKCPFCSYDTVSFF